MKKIIFVLVLVSCFTGYVYAQDIVAQSRITEVTVFSGDALVNRVSSLKLNQGEQKIILSGIIPELDENSLRVSGSGTAEVKILGASVKKEFLEEAPAEKVKKLQDDLQQLTDDRKKIENLKKILAEEKQFLDSIRLFSQGQIPKDLVTRMPPPKDLEETLKFLTVKLKENFDENMAAEINIRDVDKKIEVVNNELSQISGPARKLTRSIVVEVDVAKPGALDLNVSYMVSGASWYPLYDARTDFNSASVDLVSFGVVNQSTGEDWTDVSVSLSTARVNVSGSMPEISPWFIRPYQPPRVMYDANVSGGRGGMAYKAMAPMEMGAMEEQEAPAVANAVYQYAEAEEKGVSVIYKISRKATIKADGSEYKLPVSGQTLKAEFNYSAYPRLSTFAYLTSSVINGEDQQLLGGRVNVFSEGDFVGTSSIENVGPGEKFDLSLGVDENVKVKREQLQKKVDQTIIGNIPGLTKRIDFKYKLTVENYKSKKINVKLYEAMPVSEDDRIKVKINNLSLEPKEKDWKDKKGIYLWEFELEPKAKKEITYSYTIEHPRDMQVEGL